MDKALLLKALHLSFMVAWFAGIFYLPRLFVNHAAHPHGDIDELLKGMERRLLWFVTPFALLTILCGVLLTTHYGAAWFSVSTWLHYKLVLIVLLVAYHGYCFKLLADFKHNRNKRSPRFYRVFNEIPVFMLFGVIFLAVYKPIAS